MLTDLGPDLYRPRHPRVSRYLAGWRTYAKMPQAEPVRVMNAYPQLHDRTGTHTLDAHYFYVSAWAMRRIVAASPERHVDIGSQPILSACLSAVLPVTFLDYRPLAVGLEGLTSIGGSILDLPLEGDSVPSISCLHVARHIRTRPLR